jgi:hypothetical protein
MCVDWPTREDMMRRLPVILYSVLMVVGAGAAFAQTPQAYPPQFTNQWQNSCMESCKANALYKGREGAVCPSYCGCVIQEVQAKIPLEVAMQADKDMAAKNNESEPVRRVSQLVHQCQARFMPPQPTGQSSTKR